MSELVDDFMKVTAVIESCRTEEQTEVAKHVISKFLEKHKKDEYIYPAWRMLLYIIIKKERELGCL